jgi:ribosomal protein L37AE/L43A
MARPTTTTTKGVTMPELRHKTFKKVSIYKEHCPVCKETLRGNGSVVLPWECSCGVWKFKGNGSEGYIVTKERG